MIIIRLVLVCPECGKSNWIYRVDDYKCAACGEICYPENMIAKEIDDAKEKPVAIDCFDGEFAFLSNFYDAPVTYGGITYLNNEAAFQAQKTLDLAERILFTTLPPGKAKRKGRSVELRPDWEDVKLDIMYTICKNKFTMNPDLKEKLLATSDAMLIEGNTWNDKFWGVCDGVGENNLGKILMRIREELRNNI